MIPRIIHLIWLGPKTSQVDQCLEVHAKFAGDRRILLHTNENELVPELKEVWNKWALTPLLKSDLLRWSILMQHGGWYFDIDSAPQVPLDDIESVYQLDGSRCFATRITYDFSPPNPDILAVGTTWAGKDLIFSAFKESLNRDAIGLLAFAGDAMWQINQLNPDLWAWGKSEHFDVRNWSPSQMVRRFVKDHQSRNCFASALARLGIEAKDSSAILAKMIVPWQAAGMPERTEEQQAVYKVICDTCEHHSTLSDCCKYRQCSKKGQYLPPLRIMATWRCPKDLADASHPTGKRPDLAPAATRLGVSLSDIGRYAQALAKWTAAGMPMRDQAEVERIEREICKPCEKYVEGRCKTCGCRVNKSSIAVANKIKMVTEKCPMGKW